MDIVLGRLRWFGNGFEIAFIRTLLKRILLIFVAFEESKTSHKALEEQSQAQALLLTFFKDSMQPAAKRGRRS